MSVIQSLTLKLISLLKTMQRYDDFPVNANNFAEKPQKLPHS